MSDAAFRPRRSCLFMPGSNDRAMEKAKSLPADVIIFDLEDAVAPDAKVEARDAVAEAVQDGDYGERELVMRVNGIGTPWFEDDLAAAKAANVAAVLVPKVNSADDIRHAALGEIPVWAMVETPLAVLNIAEIAAAPALAALVMGTNDLGKDMRAAMTPDRRAFLTALSMTVTAARAHGKVAIDGVYNGIGDAEALKDECDQGRTLGFEGKSLIHPAQIDIANRIYSPSADALDEARAIIAAFEEAENTEKGVIRVNGKMAERLHLEEAKKLVALSDMIDAAA
ncbi:HpcH/HpaI aldolase/citrate lyase family protein [Parasphingopyxis marina]|uniref:CoA ester lyase n=1 Tax=Parasphingopyxis marina TaxID=2761622 RepID=A0A842I0K3_9SPHN|nr:CoA ester lyase [Parasphingopyxis marina]MBC2777284.1 CoA ester lyase [Parasphingopyxis marina]